MLDEITAEAVALAEMQTQPEDLHTAVDSVEAKTIKKGRAYCEEDGHCDG